MIGAFFGAEALGFYYLASMVINAPATLISKSVSDVLYPYLHKAYVDKKDSLSLILRSVAFLVLIGLVPFIILYLYSDEIFRFFFGPEWVKSGEYAFLMMFWIFSFFITRPFVSAISVYKLDFFFMMHELYGLVLRLLAIGIGFYFFNSIQYSLGLLSLVAVCLNIVLASVVMLKVLRERV